MNCSRCGADGAFDVTGRAGRIANLKQRFAGAAGAQRGELANKVMDAISSTEVALCAACAACGVCLFREDGLGRCVVCAGLACADCSLPAMKVEAGRLVEAEGIMCAKCNPPLGGRNAWMMSPGPAPTVLVPA